MPGRRVFIDLGPLRTSPDFRRIWTGMAAATLGNQFVTVAVPFAVYRLTNSTLDVGLISLVQLVAILVSSFGGGALADRFNRRNFLITIQLAKIVFAAILALNGRLHHPALVLIFIFGALLPGLSGAENTTRSAIVANVIPPEQFAAANALWQLLFQGGQIIGPALAGILIAKSSISSVYWISAVSSLVSLILLFRMHFEKREVHPEEEISRSVFQGLRFLRSRQTLQGVFLVDLNAMVFGMPSALFPALAVHHFHGGAQTVGLLYSAPAIGALVVAFVMGWVANIRRQGRAVLIAVTIWGAGIVGFGFSNILILGLIFLAIAGAADVVSAVFRNTILQLETPDQLRGRLQGVQSTVVIGGPRLGNFEAGVVASASGSLEFSVVSGGIACILGVLILARALPHFSKYGAVYAQRSDDGAASSLPVGSAEALLANEAEESEDV